MISDRDLRFAGLTGAMRAVLTNALLLTAFGLIASLSAGNAHAATRTVHWSHPNILNVSGFRIVVGPTSRSYDSTIEVGMPSLGDGTYETTVNIPDGRDNYVAVVAYNSAGPSAPSNEAFVAATGGASPPAPQGIFRINAGGPNSLSVNGETWTSDSPYVQSGTAGSSSASIGGTTSDALYQTFRWGGDYNLPMVYEFPVSSDGTYQITFYWAETWSAANSPGARQFDVFVEGLRRLQKFDVVAEGGFQQAVSRIVTASVNDGSITIEFHRLTEQTPFINAMEILRIPDAGTGGPISPPILIQVVPATP